MQNNVPKENIIMDFDFQDKRNVSEHFHQNLELLYVLEGNVIIKIGNEEYRMKQEDFIIINSNRRHSYYSEGERLTASLYINYSILSSYMDMNKVTIYCNTTNDRDDAYDKLRKLLRKVFNQYFDKKGKGLIYLNSLYYSILSIIVSNFMLESNDKRFQNELNEEDNRIDEIINYIDTNYQRPISLNDLSERLFLSSSYLSKYIKKKMGMNFIDYLNRIRLHCAVDEMKTTDKSIMRIAMDNGFPNAAAFNKAFKDAYHMTPSAYMEQMENEWKSEHKWLKSEPDIEQKVRVYLDNNFSDTEAEEDSTYKYMMVDALNQKPYIKAWNRMINIGLGSDLLRSDMQEHILILKKELKFEYVRFWDLYSAEMLLNVNSPDGLYNFTKLDRVFDFFVENNIKPYIELGFKPILLLRNVKNYMVAQVREILFRDLGEYRRFLYALVSHYVNRYGMEEVEKWYFEQWNDPRLSVSPDHHEYFEVFETAYHTLKSVSSQIRLGGAGFDRSHGKLSFQQIISLWKKRMCYPDFISLYCYPYLQGIDELEINTQRSQDPNFIRNHVLMVRETLKENGFYVSELHISEWNSTISNRNCLNDSCYKGAYIMKNIIDNIEQVELMGYWIGSDLFSEYYDSSLLLSGSGGLLTKDGIKKPAYYAMEFMNRLGRYLLGSNENCAVTTNGYDNYSVVCHNYKHPSFKYYMRPEDFTEVERSRQLFDDNESLKLNFQIKHVKNGTYQIKTRSLNTVNGSVQDEWLRMDLSDNLNKQDIDYLRQICTPHISIRTCTVTNSTLNFETVLKPQEIQYIHLLYQF